MAKRCDFCKHFIIIEFIENTDKGYPVYWGECQLTGNTVKNMFHACPKFSGYPMIEKD